MSLYTVDSSSLSKIGDLLREQTNEQGIQYKFPDDFERAIANIGLANNIDYNNALVAFGVESDLTDGITALTNYSNEITDRQDKTLSEAVKSLTDMTKEEWDNVLYPADEDGRFNCKWVYLEAGDIVVVDWYGHGNRVWAFRGGGDYSANNRGNNASAMSYETKDYYQNICLTHIRQVLNPVDDKTIFVAAGYEWANDGGHSANDAYVFFGEYFKYKVIHANRSN